MTRKLSDYVPEMKQGGLRVYPEDLAGIIGLPHVGNVYYVDANSGSDSNSGTTQNKALATLAAAYAKMTSGNHDVVIIAPSGGTGRTSEDTAITWGKRFAHIVGSAAPTAQDVRAGVSFATGGSISFTENGCLVKGVTFNGTADINVPVTVTGSYNSFIGVDFKGSLNSDTGDDAAARALYVNGGQENYFGGCTLGADTYMRSAANATLELASAASRNVWEGCRFVMAADATTPVHLLFTGTSAIDRWVEFRDCSWYAFYTNHADKVAQAFDLSAQTATADVLMTGQNLFVGFDDVETTASNSVWFPQYSTTTTLAGLPINNA